MASFWEGCRPTITWKAAQSSAVSERKASGILSCIQNYDSKKTFPSSWNPRLQSYLFVCTVFFLILLLLLSSVLVSRTALCCCCCYGWCYDCCHCCPHCPCHCHCCCGCCCCCCHQSWFPGLLCVPVVVAVVLIMMVLYVVCCCYSCCCLSWFPGQLYVVGVMVVFVVVILVVTVKVWFTVDILVVVSPGFQDSFGSCC